MNEDIDREFALDVVTSLGGVAPGCQNPPDERGQLVVLAMTHAGRATAMTISVN